MYKSVDTPVYLQWMDDLDIDYLDFNCGNNFLFGGIRQFYTAISSTAILHFING